ncbi:MAG: T9SS type A sorting domain-containing protein [Armatimonadetes bacterium]|nr:T9SS type A sorting domain-containing protein [Armatimonadota bacterium]
MKTRIFFLAYLFITIILPTALAAQEESGWENPFGILGANGEVTTITRVNETILIGGKFTHVGATPANGVALWDGKRWHPLGDRKNNGVNGSVYAIAVKGDEIYVGGSFTQAGDIAAMNVAVWNQTTKQWNAMKGGVRGAIFPFVSDIAVHNGNVYVGGLFTQAGGALVSNIAAWDGNTWSRVGTGTDDAVISITLHDDILYAGGRFSTAGGVEAGKIAAWDIPEQQWRNVGDGITGNAVNAIVANDTALFVGGDFVAAGAKPAKNLATWQYHSKRWDTIASINEGVQTLVFHNQDLLVGSDEFVRIHNGRITILDSSAWKAGAPEGRPTIGSIQVGMNGEVIVGGLFHNIYSAQHSRFDSQFVRVQNLFALYKDSISLYTNSVNGSVYSLFADNKNIYAGGQFTHAGSGLSRNLDAWSLQNQQWQAADISITKDTKGLRDDVIRSIIVIEDTVYASGGWLWRSQGRSGMKILKEQQIFGGVLLRHNNLLYIVNGQGVSSIQNDKQVLIAPKPTNYTYGPYIHSALIHDEYVYIGGYFGFDSNGVKITASLGRWDATTEEWNSVGGIVDREAYSIAMDSAGKIIIGGVLKKTGNIPVKNIAMWDPSTGEWSDMGGGANDTVFSVLVYQNNVYAAGAFSEIGGIRANRIARWDGKQWHPLGLGIQGSSGVIALAINDSGHLYVGGNFSSVDGIPAHNLARWNTTLPQSSAEIVASTKHVLEVSNIYCTGQQQLVISLARPIRGEATVEIFTIVGQQVESFQYQLNNDAYQLSADLSKLPSGYYFCTISGNGERTTQRLMIAQ